MRIRETLAKEVVAKNLTREQLKQRLAQKSKSNIPNVNSEKDNNSVSFAVNRVKASLDNLESVLKTQNGLLSAKEIEEIENLVSRIEKLRLQSS